MNAGNKQTKQSLLLITPPFTQLNTPYPATAYLKGFLNTKDVSSSQMDLGIDTILNLFSKQGLTDIFLQAEKHIHSANTNAKRIFTLRENYINTIDPVIQFLQDQDPTLAHFIAERNFLPEASKFAQLEDLEWAFGTMGLRDQARHIASLYLEDLGDFIVEVIDPHFGFSRYAERLGISANSFDELYAELHKSNSYITDVMLGLLDEKIRTVNPSLVCLSVPFPGNLFAAFKTGQFIKKNYPDVKIAMGGGYPNTELRSLSDTRVFEFLDFITLDDGETPLLTLCSYLDGKIDVRMLKRCFTLVDDAVEYCNESLIPDVKQNDLGTPDYFGLPLKQYLSVIQITNPMHRLWSDGRWNKLTLAHGCYWGKCTFCDISLDYIKNYEASSASIIVDRMETLIAQTGERGFHFVDEAAPPALMKAVALEILKRKIVVNWWTNIRFEKSFHYDLCRLLAASGCIAVSGGLEVASDRLLELIAKGVTVEQVSLVNQNFNAAGIMVHAYLMYGFPTQTAQETIDSLEVVRQMFEQGILQSAFWHRFAMTAHSPVGMQQEDFKVKALNATVGSFANNDLDHEDPTGTDHALFSKGLHKSLYNFMHGVCMDHPLQNWFDHEVPSTSHPPDLIESYLNKEMRRQLHPTHVLLWLHAAPSYDAASNTLCLTDKQEDILLSCSEEQGRFIASFFADMAYGTQTKTYAQFKQAAEDQGWEDFSLFWYGALMENLKEKSLLVL